ncbi:unnamed protein product [Durusdinium trenchii]|uniref:Uncharacterized protein n=2 Tax=Durusdinium trenchii TaxID=1381693 RepID=A0ABP0PBV9_9DINO
MDGVEALARPNALDSERTRLLKQVLQSSSRLQRELRVTLGTPAPKASKFSSFDPTASKPKEQLPSDRIASSSLKDRLQLCAQGHSEICEDCDAGDLGREMSPVLKSCGERIGSLSGKIFSLEDQLTLRGGVLPQREEDSSLAIEIIPHGQQASAATRQKEEAADRALASHARFASLEELQENLQKHASSYDDLRQLFPRRHRWNPNLYLLTDETLKNPHEFKEAVWRKLPKEEDDIHRNNTRGSVRWRRSGSPKRAGSKRVGSKF